MSSPIWNIELTLRNVTTHGWGGAITDEFSLTNATSHFLKGDGGVWLVVTGDEFDDVAIIDFGKFWLESTYKRWTHTSVTYREGSQGLWLQFPNANSADQFDTCCDRILPVPVQAGTLRPTLEHLRDLGLVSAPRVVGEFYSSEREARDETIARSWSFDDITSLAADDLSDAMSESDLSANELPEDDSELLEPLGNGEVAADYDWFQIDA